MMARYWVRFTDQTEGPHTLKILHELPGFSGETLVCPTGEVVWRKASEVETIKALLDTDSEEAIEKMLMSPKEQRRQEKRRKAREEKEEIKREERERSEEERKKIAGSSSGGGGFNPMWLVFLLVVGGFSYAFYQKWKEDNKPEPPPPKVVLPNPDRMEHWAWKALGKSKEDIEKMFGKDSVEALKPDGSARFETGGDLGRWLTYDEVLILLPKAGLPYGNDEGIGTVSIRKGKVRGAGRRYEVIDPEDMPKLTDVLPKSFANKYSQIPKPDDVWRFSWDIGGESWGALVLLNPGSDPALKDWRVKEFWVTRPD
ncbi:MAG: hypothetical protein COB53_03205 [Elusimicrobia bacterium]|nr:MAG: hypothetical protein COB53_03205 [Elusimicrobiota bacterium]